MYGIKGFSGGFGGLGRPAPWNLWVMFEYIVAMDSVKFPLMVSIHFYVNKGCKIPSLLINKLPHTTIVIFLERS